jgi:hypothetical protein
LVEGRIVTSEECLKHAEECEQLAAMAKLPSNQQALLASATMWRNLAADTKAADGAGPIPVLGDLRSET